MAEAKKETKETPKAIEDLFIGADVELFGYKPEAQPITEVVKDLPWRIMIFGLAKTGKTHFTLSSLNHLKDKLGMKPEEILIIWLDLDGKGVAGLIKKFVVGRELWDRIEYYDCPTDNKGNTAFEKAVVSLEEGLKKLDKHAEKYGKKGCWILMDNESEAWESVRDWYSRRKYRMSLAERVMEKREAGWGDKGVSIAPPFDMRGDYGVINPMYDMYLLDKIRDSGYNFIITSLGRIDPKSQRKGVEGKADKKETFYHAGGKKDADTKADWLIEVFLDDSRTRRSDLYGSRMLSENMTIKNIVDMDFPSFANIVEEAEIVQAHHFKVMPDYLKLRAEVGEEIPLERVKEILRKNNLSIDLEGVKAVKKATEKKEDKKKPKTKKKPKKAKPKKEAKKEEVEEVAEISEPKEKPKEGGGGEEEPAEEVSEPATPEVEAEEPTVVEEGDGEEDLEEPKKEEEAVVEEDDDFGWVDDA